MNDVKGTPVPGALGGERVVAIGVDYCREYQAVLLENPDAICLEVCGVKGSLLGSLFTVSALSGNGPSLSRLERRLVDRGVVVACDHAPDLNEKLIDLLLPSVGRALVDVLKEPLSALATSSVGWIVSDSTSLDCPYAKEAAIVSMAGAFEAVSARAEAQFGEAIVLRTWRAYADVCRKFSVLDRWYGYCISDWLMRAPAPRSGGQSLYQQRIQHVRAEVLSEREWFERALSCCELI